MSAGATAGHPLRRLALAATVLDLFGVAVARRRGLVGEPLRLTAPASLPTLVVLAGFGTAVSGPLLVDVALGGLAPAADAGAPRARAAIRTLAWLRLLGVLAEPITWGRRRPRSAMVLSAAHIAVAMALLQYTGDP
jgi:hypothetical protein